MHEDFIQAMVYRRLPKGHPTYWFHFLAPRTQAWWKKGLELCIEADSVFSRCNHHRYRGRNLETQGTTLWHRHTATRFCTDALWENLKENARDGGARFTVEALQDEHKSHHLFLHHTMESLLYVANTILPPLQKALQQARKMLKRWSWLPWVPKAFVDHYDVYLTLTEEKLNEIASQLREAIKARVELVLHAADGKTGDVIMALIGKLWQEVPGFIHDERLKASETLLSLQDFLQDHNQRVLPTTMRQVTREELSKAVQYLYQCKETSDFALDSIEKANEAYDPLLPLTVKDNKGKLLLFPHSWQPKENASSRDVVNAYPWCRYWTLQEGLALLQLNNRMKTLIAEDEMPRVLSPEIVTAQLTILRSMMDVHSRLARYQEKVAAYQPKSSWFRFFAKGEKTTQYQAWVLQQQQLNAAMKAIQCQQTAWIIRHAPSLIKNAPVYSPSTWIQIIDGVRLVTLPRLEAHGKGDDRDPIIATLHTAYQRLRIASSPFLAGEKNIKKDLRGEEVFTIQAIKTLLATQTSIPQHQLPIIETWANELKAKPVLLADWQGVLRPLLKELQKTWSRCIDECGDSPNAVDYAAKEIFFHQCIELLAWWQPNFRGSQAVLQAKEALKKRYHALAPQQVKARHYLQQLNMILDTVVCKRSGNPFNDNDWAQTPLPRGNPPRTSSNNPFFDDCRKKEMATCENVLPKIMPQEPASTTTVDDTGEELKPQDDAPMPQPTTGKPTGDVLEKPLSQPEPPCVSSSLSQVVTPTDPFELQEPLNTATIATEAMTVPSRVAYDPQVQQWVEAIKQGLLANPNLRSNQYAVNAFLEVAEKMATEGAIDLMQWPERFNLYPEVQALLYVNIQEIVSPGFWDRLLGTKVPFHVREFRFIINIVARLYQWDKGKLDAGQQQQVVLEYLSGFESVIKTPQLLEACRKLITELRNTMIVLNNKFQPC